MMSKQLPEVVVASPKASWIGESMLQRLVNLDAAVQSEIAASTAAAPIPGPGTRLKPPDLYCG
jgi:hypothetical protein